MARPRKVVDISTGKIGKKEKANRKEQEAQLKLNRDELECDAPDWLDEDGKEEYTRVVREAGKINILDNLDRGVLAIYANSYSMYVSAARKVRRSGNKLVVAGQKGKDVPTPYIAIMSEAAKQIMACSAKLGMATTDRLKLIVPTKEEKSVNKFLKYL